MPVGAEIFTGLLLIGEAVEEGEGLLTAPLDGLLQPLHVLFIGRQLALVVRQQRQCIPHHRPVALGVRFVVDPRAFASTRDQIGFGQNPQVSGDSTLPHLQDREDLVDIERRTTEETHQSQTRFVSQSFVDLEGFGHGVFFFEVQKEYTGIQGKYQDFLIYRQKTNADHYRYR